MSVAVELPSFRDLGLSEALNDTLSAIGYENPSPIQAETIPPLLAGRDVLGQAQTGTGKTAAFALPALSQIDLNDHSTQVLVLAPTRELALQVAEAFQTYARHLPGFQVLPIYGGQGYDSQLRQLRRGAQVVVGTPGRVMDHMRRGTLKLDGLRTLVLDEADEMLRMGFIDDVEWVLQQTPETRQIALFSATMPNEVRRVAKTYLNDPVEVKIASRTTTATTIRQRYWAVSGLHKLDALTRILESETFEAMLVFVRTKNATLELAEKLNARGYSAEALNGDIAQAHREKIVARLKNGSLDIVIATDVAARGLDVERISHVINYDIPYDTEAYVHRIGRTGRAGRSGDAILFVAPREKRMLFLIEKATGQTIEAMHMPTASDINRVRVQRFQQRISDTVSNVDLAYFEHLLSEFQQEQAVEPLKMAAALAHLLQGEQPLLLNEQEAPRRDKASEDRRFREQEPRSRDRDGERSERRPRRDKAPPSAEPIPLKGHPDIAMQRYRVAVGHMHGVKPGNIVGAIANEADIESRFIGHIEIYDDYSVVDLPAGMDESTAEILQRTRVCGQSLRLQPFREGDVAHAPAKPARRRPRSEPSAPDAVIPAQGSEDEPATFPDDDFGNLKTYVPPKPARKPPHAGRGKPAGKSFPGKSFSGKPFSGKPAGKASGKPGGKSATERFTPRDRPETEAAAKPARKPVIRSRRKTD